MSENEMVQVPVEALQLIMQRYSRGDTSADAASDAAYQALMEARDAYVSSRCDHRPRTDDYGTFCMLCSLVLDECCPDCGCLDDSEQQR